MFEDSLVESQGRIRTRSRWFAIGSFFTQAALLLLLILFPLFHPQALPRQSLERLLVAPPPPRAPARMQTPQSRPASSSHPTLPSFEAELRLPGRIPSSISSAPEGEPPALSPMSDVAGEPSGLPAGIPLPTIAMVRPPAPSRPLNISSGVAAGQLLHPILPVYPAIAKAARIQGTVVLEATISRQGAITGLRVVEGPPMLCQAALDAVSAAHYRPFLLNGEPVEVKTSVRVIFSLGG